MTDTYTTRQACEILGGMTRQRLFQLAAAAKITPLRSEHDRRRVFWRSEDIHALIARRAAWAESEKIRLTLLTKGTE